MAPRENVVRRALRWWMKPPADPWVGFGVAIDFLEARRYLDALRERGVGATVQHLLAACVGRVLGEFPRANARLVGGRVMPVERVGVAMPVSLLGHPAGRRQEMSLVIVDGAERLSLREIVARASRDVAGERADRPAQPLLGPLMRLGERLPEPVFEGALELFAWLMRRRAFVRGFYHFVPMTTSISNPGAAVGSEVLEARGLLVRGGNYSMPVRPLHLATLWGISAVQDEVVARDGAAVVRPMLPVTLMFDHRLFDGVMAGRMLARLAELLQAPAAAFGERGEKAP